MESTFKLITKKFIPLKLYFRLRRLYLYLDNATFNLRHKFSSVHGYKLNLDNPQSFNEKIICKRFYDKNPLIALTSDKFAVRQYVAGKLGIERSKKHLIPLLFTTDRPQTIPFDDLPGEYIIKPNHGSGWYIIAESTGGNKKFSIKDSVRSYCLADSEKARVEVAKICSAWLKTNYGVLYNEWAYKKIKPMIIIEKLLRNSNGSIPDIYRLHMFHGHCRTINLYDTEWNLLDVTFGNRPKRNISKPRELDEMIKIGEALSSDFDYARIDLYIADSNIYFSEITHYPFAGFGKFIPTEFDFKFGSYWKIK
jgi:hypothetical protein